MHAELDNDSYPKGIRISDKEMRALEQNHIIRHDFHGEWNYTLTATKSP